MRDDDEGFTIGDLMETGLFCRVGWFDDIVREPDRVKALVKSRPPRKPRKPTLAGALKEADRAGRPVRGAVIAPSGEFTLQFGEPDRSEANEWDAEISRMSKQ